MNSTTTKISKNVYMVSLDNVEYFADIGMNHVAFKTANGSLRILQAGPKKEKIISLALVCSEDDE